MQNGHGNATADGRNRYSTSIAKRSNRILLRSHELPPGVSFPSIVCNVHTRLRSRHIRYAPGRIASALRCATRVASPSIIRKSVGGRVGTQASLVWNFERVFRRRHRWGPLSVGALAFVWGSRDARRDAGPLALAMKSRRRCDVRRSDGQAQRKAWYFSSIFAVFRRRDGNLGNLNNWRDAT